MTEESKNLQFTIEQLRQDKIIYAVDACAVILICLFIFFFSNEYFNGIFKMVINVLSFAVAFTFMLYAIIGNILRFIKILSLQKKLPH